MSQGKIFKLLQESSETVESLPVLSNLHTTDNNITCRGESEPFTISSSSNHHHHHHPVTNSSRDDEGSPESPWWCNKGLSTALKLEDGQLLPKHLKDSFDFDKLACKPLQEVDVDYAKAQTFLTIGRDGRVHRFAARQFPFILNPSHPLRRAGIYLLSQWHLPILIGISLTLLSTSLLLPNYARNSDESHLANVFRYITTVLVLGEICVKAVARGVLVTNFTYLRNSWDWLDVIMILSLIIGYCWKHPLIHSLQGIALLKFIPLVPALKEGFGLFVKSLKTLTPPFLYTLILFWILIVLGFKIVNYNYNVQIYNSENTRPSCGDILLNITNTSFANDNDTSTESHPLQLPDIEANSTLNNFAQMSSINCSSKQNASLVNTTLSFIDFVTLHQLGGVGNENVKFVQMSFVYSILVLLFGTCGSFVLAISSVGCFYYLYNYFEVLQETRSKENETFSIRINDKNTKSKSTKKFFMRACLPKTSCSINNCDPGCALFVNLNGILYHPFSELLVTVVIAIDIILLFLDYNKFQAFTNFHPLFTAGSKVCMIFYTVELILKLISGPYRYFMNAGAYLDIFVVLAFIVNELLHPIKWILPIRTFRIAPRWPAFYAVFPIAYKTFASRVMILTTILLGAIHISSKQFIQNESFSIFSFAFKNWEVSFKLCRSVNSNSICFSLFLLEIIVASTFLVVLLVGTILATARTVKMEIEEYHTLTSHKSLCKAMKDIQSQLSKVHQCIGKGSESSNVANESAETDPKKPNESFEIVGTNGGPSMANGSLKNNSTHNHTNAFEPPSRTDNDQGRVCYPNLELSYLICVVSAFLAQAVHFDEKQRINPIHNPRLIIDLVFTLYTFVYLVWIFVVQGARKYGILKWSFDFVVMLATGFTLYTSLRSSTGVQDLPGIKLIALISCLKGLMLIEKINVLKIAVSGCVHEIRVVWQYILACGILYLSLGAFTSQAQFLTETSPLMFPTKIVQTILFGIVFGVAYFNFQDKKLVDRFLTSAQAVLYLKQENLLSQEKTLIIPFPKKGLCTHILHYMTQTDAFEVTVMFTIICDCLVITFSHLAETKDWQIVWQQYPPVIISIYCVELMLKAYGWRKYFFRSKWNMFDCFIVALSLIDILAVKIQVGPITADFVRFLRIINIFHMNITQRHVKPLMSTCLFKTCSLPVLNIGLLYLIGVLTYSSIGFVMIHSSIFNPSQQQQETSTPIRDIGIFGQILKSLVLMSFHDISKNNVPSYTVILRSIYPDHNHLDWFAQVPSCSRDFYHYLLSTYSCTFWAFSYFIFATIFVIVMSEITKGFARFLQSPTDLVKDDEEDEFRPSSVTSRYKYSNCKNNGMLPLYSISLGESGDDPTSMDTALTPLSEIHPEERIKQLNDEIEPVDSRRQSNAVGQEENRENCPVKVSANGYVLRVEAIVTTV